MIETIIILILFAFGLFYTDTVSTKSFFNTDNGYLLGLKEKDYDFLLIAKYGEKIDCNKVFMTRIKNAFYCALIFIALMLVMGQLSFLNIVVVLILSYAIFKSGYSNLKAYYKRYMAQVDLLLPYYLKNLEILCQNYTVPVAISRSIDQAPDVFKRGLREMVAKIDAGDSSIQPYMDFAIQYPVRDSMRMMRLLYRLGLGAQENKYKQLLVFSKSVSSLQNKARETKYKQRLEHMENQTMIMLVVTGVGLMLIILVSMLMMFSI